MSEADTDDQLELLRQQTILAKFGEHALRTSDLDNILTEACRLVGEALGTDLAKVMELRDDGETLLARAGVGWKPGVVGKVTLKASEETSEGHALRTGQPMISPDIRTERRFSYPPFLVENGVKAVANVVIIGAKGKPPFGILQVDSRSPRQFSDNDTAFLRGYANLLAAAVDRLRVFDDMRKATLELRESRDRQEAALRTGLIGFFEWNIQASTFSGDKRFARFYGIDPIAAASGLPVQQVFDRLHPSDRAEIYANVHAALGSLSDFANEFRIVHPSSQVRWLHVRGHCYEHAAGQAIRYTGTVVDITTSKEAEATLLRANEALEAKVIERTRELVAVNTKLRAEAEERERVEEALRQSHKMEAVGQLTGGLAHDFNNLLAGISGSLELIRIRTEQGRTADLGRYIDTAMVSVDRAAALTHRLLAFSRRQTLDPKPTNVNRLVADMEDLFRRTVGPAVQLTTNLVSEPWLALCDPNQLESAVLNLVINARDAMPDGGQLIIETGNITLPARHEAGRDSLPMPLPPGDYITVSVTDTGTGMTPNVLAHAFDPFFTTKPLGQGTGLGLSMIYGFAQQSEGQVRLRSEEGHGTSVTIHLPRLLTEAVEEASGPYVIRAEAERATEAGTVVLAVEDEPAVRMVIRDVLSDLGYTVLESGDSRAGLAVVESEARIDLLLTDVGLPGGMNGRQLADAARQRRPGLKVLFITGYAESTTIGKGLLDQGMEVMTKPFAVHALVSKVQAIIQSQPKEIRSPNG